MFVDNGIDLEILGQTRGVVGYCRHHATLDLHLVTAVVSFWSMPTMMPGMLYPRTIEGKITAAVVSVLNGALQCQETGLALRTLLSFWSMFGIVVNQRVHCIKSTLASKSIFAHATAKKCF